LLWSFLWEVVVGCAVIVGDMVGLVVYLFVGFDVGLEFGVGGDGLLSFVVVGDDEGELREVGVVGTTGAVIDGDTVGVVGVVGVVGAVGDDGTAGEAVVSLWCFDDDDDGAKVGILVWFVVELERLKFNDLVVNSSLLNGLLSSRISTAWIKIAVANNKKKQMNDNWEIMIASFISFMGQRLSESVARIVIVFTIIVAMNINRIRRCRQ